MKSTLKIGVGIIFLLANLQQVFSQNEFAKVYKSCHVTTMAKTFDGSYVLAGERNYKSFLMKIDPGGAIIWNRSIKDNSNSNSYSCIIACNDSTLLLVSTIQNPTTQYNNVLCIKLNNDGDTIWTKTFDMNNSAYPYSVRQTFDGGFIIAGNTYQKTAPYYKIMVIKLDPDGNLQWSETLVRGNHSNFAYTIEQIADSGYILSGYYGNQDPYETNAYLMKLTQAGSVVWSKRYLSSDLHTRSLDFEKVDNGYMVVMEVSDTVNVINTDTAGNIIWAKNYDSEIFEFVNSPETRIVQMSDGEFTISVSSFSDFGDILLKINDTGNVKWAKRIMMYLADMVETTYHGYIIAGNGPFLTPKLNNAALFEPQIGLIKTNALDENSSVECMFDFEVSSHDNISLINDTILFETDIIGVLSQRVVELSSNNLTVSNSCVEITGGINEEVSNNNIRIFPNPTNGILQVEWDNSIKVNTIRIYGSAGNRIRSFEVNDNSKKLEINTLQLPAGIYLIRINNEYVRRFIKY